MAEFEIEWRDAELTASIETLETHLYRLGKRRFGGHPDRKVSAKCGIILQPQFLHDRNRILLKSVIDRVVIGYRHSKIAGSATVSKGAGIRTHCRTGERGGW